MKHQVTDTALNVDETSFRTVLGHFATGVVVVTAMTPHGPSGMTCQSLVSVSVNPPLVSFCPSKASQTWPKIDQVGVFCINVLTQEQQHVCSSFARSGPEKFEGISWSPDHQGSPILDGALAWISCTVTKVHDAGDHFMVLAAVTNLGRDLNPDPSPLLYFRGEFGDFVPSESAFAYNA